MVRDTTDSSTGIEWELFFTLWWCWVVQRRTDGWYIPVREHVDSVSRSFEWWRDVGLAYQRAILKSAHLSSTTEDTHVNPQIPERVAVRERATSETFLGHRDTGAE